jgi:pyruvate-formate lyase
VFILNSRIKSIYDQINNKKHHACRQEMDAGISEEFTSEDMPLSKRSVKRTVWVLEHEKPVILPFERIVCTRTIKRIPGIYTKKEWDKIKDKHYIHESGKVCNICSDFATVLDIGLEGLREKIKVSAAMCGQSGDETGIDYLGDMTCMIDAAENFAERYADAACEAGHVDIAEILRKVPKYGAQSFHEALQSFRIIHFILWCSGNYHNTIGRFDQYMYPYLAKDLKNGIIDHDGAFELLEEFFLSFNKDSDLYPGMQQGDNGQSMVLGGMDRNGCCAYNLLSEMCLDASLDLKLIDPKINLRVSSETPLHIFGSATLLTKQGLGFPQYNNDDIVIPGLIDLGYDIEDARDYTVAACWEFIIPGSGMDIPNIGALSFLKVINHSIEKYLRACDDFGSFMSLVKNEIRTEIDLITGIFKNIYLEPAPFQSLLMKGCIENARDISLGCRYNNFGIHGTGISNAAESLAVVKKYIYDEKRYTADDLISAMQVNFEGYDELWCRCMYEAPKMGCDDDYVDNIAVDLLDIFADALKGKRNERGGCYRPGTGSAMYYLWHAKELGASADGRKKGESLSANFSPSLNVRTNGPVSVIRSFSKPDYRKVINGGPLTIELHDTVLRNNEGVQKTAMLVKYFIDKGGHQLQINAVNREKLIDAQKNPDNYRNLIVRVWGWSGYFVELDKEYQDHIISRTEFE